MISQLQRDIDNVHHRIFDHRAFVNGEISAFLNNFEVKRNEVEVETLFKITETVGELKYELSDRCLALGTANLNDISKELKTTLSSIEQFLEEVKEDKPPSEKFIQSQLEREQKRIKVYNDLEYGFQRVSDSFEGKEEEIAELYSDLQLKLNIPK